MDKQDNSKEDDNNTDKSVGDEEEHIETEEPKNMSWTTFAGWYKNNKQKNVLVREAWNVYKEKYGIKTKTKTNKLPQQKKTSTERRKKKGIRLLLEDKELIIDFIIKERYIGEDRKTNLKKALDERDWNNLREFLRDNVLEEIKSISIIQDRPEIVSITLNNINKDDIKNIKKSITKLTKSGIDSVVKDRLKFYLT
jgi:hypothetical protein